MIRNRNRKGNITVTTVIFLATFIVFCAFGTDTAFVVLSRFKLQRATETAALATAAFLKTQEDVVDNDPRALAKASQILRLSRLNVVDIASIETKQTPEGGFKVRLQTQMPVETFFLRFVAVNEVTIEAKSTAETYIQTIDDAKFAQAIELQPVMTDKTGDDFSIESPNGYFVFLGVDTPEGIAWQDASCKAQAPSAQRTLGDREFGFLCENTTFDLSIPCGNNDLKAARARALKDYENGTITYSGIIQRTIYYLRSYSTQEIDLNSLLYSNNYVGIAKYITVYRDLNPNACPAPLSADELKISVLNNVKLIPSSDF